MANNSGAPRSCIVIPAIKPIDLLVELRRECADLRPKLFRNELLKNFCESITLADILIAGSLVNNGDDAYRGEAVLEDRGALRQADEALIENTLLLRVD